MYTDAASYTNASYSSSIYDSTASQELGQEEFLTLLVTQLENQDPLNPLEDTEMIAELAQFSQLEEMESMNTTLETVSSQLNALSVNSAVSYIGKSVEAAGNTVALTDGEATDVTYTLPQDAESLKAHIYDDEYNLVASVDIGSISSGEHTFTWNGLDANGNTEPDGTYYVGFEAYDADGEGIVASSQVAGRVTGISSQDGETILELDDGRTVSLLGVSRVVSDDTASGTEEG